MKALKLESWASVCSCAVSQSYRNVSRGKCWQCQLDGSSSGQPWGLWGWLFLSGTRESVCACARAEVRAHVSSVAVLADSCCETSPTIARHGMNPQKQRDKGGGRRWGVGSWSWKLEFGVDRCRIPTYPTHSYLLWEVWHLAERLGWAARRSQAWHCSVISLEGGGSAPEREGRVSTSQWLLNDNSLDQMHRGKIICVRARLSQVQITITIC